MNPSDSNLRPSSLLRDPAPSTSAAKQRPAGLRVYLILIWTITALTAVSLLWYFLHGDTLLEAQLWSEGPDRFGDLWHYHALFQYLHTSTFFTSEDRFAYPAPSAVLYALLYQCGRYTHTVFNLILGVTEALSAALFYRMLRRYELSRGFALLLTGTLLLTSYPWHMLYDRGNLELFVYIGLAGGMWAYLRKQPMLAAVLWGCTGALKLYPLVVLLVLLHRDTLKDFALGALSSVVTFLGSCWYVGPSIASAAIGSLHGITGFLGHYAGTARRSELNQDHTILGAIKEVLSLNMLHLGQNWPHLSLYYEVAAAILAPCIYLRWVRRQPLLNQLALLIVALVLLPPVSYDYTLIHTYLVMGIVVAAYLGALRSGRTLPHAKVFFAAFAVLATSQTWIELRGLRVNGILKCAALLLICLLLLRIPLTIDAMADGFHAED